MRSLGWRRFGLFFCLVSFAWLCLAFGNPLLAVEIKESQTTASETEKFETKGYAVGRALRRPYYPGVKNSNQLKLNYYYNRTNQWVKFSDWIPKRQWQYEPKFLEDYYELIGLSLGSSVPEIKENIFFLEAALRTRFRHPARALTKIRTEKEYARYRALMFMSLHYQIMRMYLRLGSKYDKRNFTFYDADFSDRFEVFFWIARSYYYRAYPYWVSAQSFAKQAKGVRTHVDLPSLESKMYRIHTGEIDFSRIIGRHVQRVEAKLNFVDRFLDQEGRPRPVKKAMDEEMQNWRENPRP